MGFLRGVSSIAAPARMRAMDYQQYVQSFWGGDDVPEPWLGSTLGGYVSPDLAMSLTHVYCAVDTISSDLGTMACQTYEALADGSRRRVMYGEAGIGSLAFQLRWQPNSWQSAKAFWSTLAWQYLLRPMACAEIIYRPGLTGFVEQVIPRHPDRVHEKTAVMPDGSVKFAFEITDVVGRPRTLTQNEMFVIRNTSADGLKALGRLQYGSKALLTGLGLQDFTKNYFRKGATAALLGTYKGAQMEDEEEGALHKSITRYMSGAENAGGLLLVPEDIDVKALGVDPEKAQLIELKNFSGRDVARLFKMPPSWLGIEGPSEYKSPDAEAQNYINRVQMPLLVEFEQAIQRDLIVVRDKYFCKFNMDYLLRADTKTRFEAYAMAIKSRVMRPSEARIREDMNPDPALDKLSESDNRPGQPRQAPSSSSESGARSGRAQLKALLAVHDNAVRCVRRERYTVEKLAKKHASDVAGWQAALKEFYADHAGFIAQTMRLSIDRARAYAAEHGTWLEAKGIVIFDEHFERDEADELAALTLDDDSRHGSIVIGADGRQAIREAVELQSAATEEAAKKKPKRKVVTFVKNEAGDPTGAIIEEAEAAS